MLLFSVLYGLLELAHTKHHPFLTMLSGKHVLHQAFSEYIDKRNRLIEF